MTTAAPEDDAGDTSPAGSFRDWPVWGRRTVYVAAGLVLLLVAGLVAAVVVARRPLPETGGRAPLPGLGAEVEVLRDDHGIPHVYADTSADLFAGQGYVQAQDRFFEMDFRRHVTAGRLSELLGESTVATDMFIRTMGWRRVAEQEYDLLAPETREHLEAFSNGVNAYLEQRSGTKLSLEYTVLGLTGLNYQPEEWTPVDSLAWLKAMAWDLRGNMDEEIARTRLSVARSPEEVAELYPRYDADRFAPIINEAGDDAVRPAPRPAPGRAALAALDAVERGTDAIPALLGTGDGVGSNSWVVSGQHTVSGQPLLANDPHLGSSMPGVWYQMGLHCRALDADCPFDVSGFTFAGVPGVVIGHNRDIAWGMTNLDPDVTDLYLEKITGKTYLYGGEQVPLGERDEVIRVAGESSRLVTVRSTRHGPLVSDVSAELSSVGANAEVPGGSPPRENGYAVALAWTALTPRPTADALFMFNTARSWTEFREAARRFAVPSQNLVYADREGNIGYQAPGAIPVRSSGHHGDYPVAGWLPENDWTGREVPFERLPNVFNPPEGFVVTANQAVTGPDYRWYLSDSPDHGYRSQRIRTLLQQRLDEGVKVDVEDMTTIQLDTRNPAGPMLVPYLLRQMTTSEYYNDGQRLLAGWNFTQGAGSAPAAYFNAVWRHLLRLTFEDQLRESLWPDGGQRWIAVVGNLLRQPGNQWWDDATTDGVVEDRDTILNRAMRAARDELTNEIGVNPNRWAWGRLHHLELEHPTLGRSGNSLVESIFNRGPFEVGGGNAVVNATGWDATEGYDVTSSPSMRMVVDLDDLERSRWIALTGVSGHAASSHYRDQTPLWVQGRSLPWRFGRAEVRGGAEDRLVLAPDG